MILSHDLKKAILDCVSRGHELEGKRRQDERARGELKIAEEHARRANQKLIDELRRDPNRKDGRRVIVVDGRSYLVDPLACAGGGVVAEVFIERES